MALIGFNSPQEYLDHYNAVETACGDSCVGDKKNSVNWSNNIQFIATHPCGPELKVTLDDPTLTTDCKGDDAKRVTNPCLEEVVTNKADEIIAAIEAKKDFETITNTVCDSTTDTYHYITTPYVDGVAGTPVNTDSGIACSQPMPEPPQVDVEFVCNKATGFYDQVVTVTTGGVPAAPVITATTISCAESTTTQSVSEVEVCADGVQAIRKTTTLSDGAEVVAVIDSSGAVITPTTVTVGSCPATPITTKTDQTHVIVHGVNTNVPAGLKSVSINNLTGVTAVDGTFELGDGRRPNGIDYKATEIDDVRGLLPAIALAGGTWQWSGVQPIAEV